MDNIDLDVAQDYDIGVFRTKTTPAPAVAELTLGLILNVARKISLHDRYLRSENWKKEMGILLQRKTLGIIGLGAIGKTLVRLINGFNFNILAYDLDRDEAFQKENNITYCNLDTLLKESDIISIHLNLSDQTRNLINNELLELMKSESILINTSRGEVVDEEALCDVLKQGKILGAGLDVYNQEPYEGQLAKLDNVVLTPHIGSYAKEIRVQMEIEAVKNLIKGMQSE